MSDFDQQEKRLAEIFRSKEAPDVTAKTLKVYLAYLKDNIELPCHLTGIEDFSWEERYVFGYGSKSEYERLKKTRASYTDIFELLEFEEEVDSAYGILVNVKRTSDNKKFTLSLSDLEATDKQSTNYQLFDDFSVWFVNYR
jgi:hypothetical protein